MFPVRTIKIVLQDREIQQDRGGFGLGLRCCKLTARIITVFIGKNERSFRLLAANHIIPQDLAARLEGMVGFRNVLVHEYEQLDISLMIDVIENRLGDLLLFSDCIIQEFFNGDPS